eukprot:3681108-Pleurochrysis_carterae.AAC.1
MSSPYPLWNFLKQKRNMLRTMRFTCTQHREQKAWNQIAVKRKTVASKTLLQLTKVERFANEIGTLLSP